MRWEYGWAIIFALTVWGTFAVHVYSHESVHAAICTTYGGQPIVEYGLLWTSGVTYCSDSDNPDAVELLNSNAEIVGYNLQSSTTQLIITAFMVTFLVVMAVDKKEDTV